MWSEVRDAAAGEVNTTTDDGASSSSSSEHRHEETMEDQSASHRIKDSNKTKGVRHIKI